MGPVFLPFLCDTWYASFKLHPQVVLHLRPVGRVRLHPALRRRHFCVLLVFIFSPTPPIDESQRSTPSVRRAHGLGDCHASLAGFGLLRFWRNYCTVHAAVHASIVYACSRCPVSARYHTWYSFVRSPSFLCGKNWGLSRPRSAEDRTLILPGTEYPNISLGAGIAVWQGAALIGMNPLGAQYHKMHKHTW